MNPETIREMLQLVAELREAGDSDREINQLLRRNRNTPFNSIGTLERHAQDAGITLVDSLEAEQEPALTNPLSRATPVLQGFTGSLASDLISGLEKVGLAAEGAGGRFREQLDQQREEHPIRSAVEQGAGFLLSPIAKVGARAFTGARGAVKPAGEAITRGLVGRGASQTAANLIGGASRIGATGLLGAGIGGAEGAILAGGESFGEEDRLESALTGGAVSGAITGPLSAVGGVVREGKRFMQRAAGRGERIAEGILGESSELPLRQGVNRRVGLLEAEKTAAFKRSSAQGTDLGLDVNEVVRNNPVVRAALRRSGSQEAKKLLAQMDEVDNAAELIEQGFSPRRSIDGISFDLLDDLRDDLVRVKRAFARRMPDSTGKVPSAALKREADEALAELEPLMREAIDGFEEGLELAARSGTQRRALKEGKKLFAQSAGEVEDALVAVGNNPEAAQAFRSGLTIRLLQRLRSGPSRVTNFLEDINSTESQRKLRIILGGDEPLQRFMQEVVEVEAKGATAEKFVGLIVKYGGFTLLGSSLAGGAALSLLAN